MNAALIQTRIWRGYAHAANILGKPHNFYRSSSQTITSENGNTLVEEATGINTENGNGLNTENGQALVTDAAPIAFTTEAGTPPLSLTPYQTQYVSYNAEDMNYKKPNKYGHPTWYALFDATNAQVGDYIVSDDGTFFIAALQLLLPILVVECNRTINLSRPQQQTGVGQVGYNGTTTDNEVALLNQWPASILQGTKGERNEVNLPDDTRTPWWSILLPYYEGVTIMPSDIITDDLNRRYIVSSPELTDLGWRITASMAVT